MQSKWVWVVIEKGVRARATATGKGEWGREGKGAPSSNERNPARSSSRHQPRRKDRGSDEAIFLGPQCSKSYRHGPGRYHRHRTPEKRQLVYINSGQSRGHAHAHALRLHPRDQTKGGPVSSNDCKSKSARQRGYHCRRSWMGMQSRHARSSPNPAGDNETGSSFARIRSGLRSCSSTGHSQAVARRSLDPDCLRSRRACRSRRTQHKRSRRHTS